MNPLQPKIEIKGREIFERMRGASPQLFDSRHLTGRLMEWSMRNEALKVQLFRFVDVLPTLRSADEAADHLQQYLSDGYGAIPEPLRYALKVSEIAPWLTASAARISVQQMAKTFILAPDAAEALPRLRRMRDRPIAFTADILGETVVSEAEAEAYQQRYRELIDALAREANAWESIPHIDEHYLGPIPKANVSVKISALYSQIRATAPEDALAHLSERLRPLLREAADLGVFINFDMEHTGLKDLTLELFKRLLMEEPLRGYPHAGIALQAYLHDSETDLQALIAWSKLRGTPITVRLTKGAYWDYETVMAHQRGWPVPVFEHKHETDANYERLAKIMLENHQVLRCAFGSHSVRSIAACATLAEELGLPQNAYEIQMLYGMAEPIKQVLIEMRVRVREYCPIGDVLPGMSYLVRRLLENTSNEGFLRATFSEHQSMEQLLRDPTAVHPTAKSTSPKTDRTFHNEPPVDFTIAANRQRLSEALKAVRGELGQSYPLRIDGQSLKMEREIISVNPARPLEVIGRVAKGGKPEAELAIVVAREAFKTWRKTSIEERVRVMERAAALMQEEKFHLAALEVFEVGKNWTEAEADVAEAIDFCHFYAQQMQLIAESHHPVPGEANLHHYIPRGVAVIIAPWNFPLAILCGMTVAALITGNTVIIKPSAQSPVIGSRFMDILERAGVPAGVANYLPCSGGEVGDFLVAHPQVDLIAFTGSREVGLRIYQTAGITHPGQANLKKVICEMGGKNALIVDNDADLDEAIPAILASAFGFQGQKCSALSRLIVLHGVHDRLVERLIEACRSMRVGLPEDPATAVGPVIDEAAYKKILEYIEIGKREATLAYQAELAMKEGYFVPPTLFTNVSPTARIAQDEIFGPVLSILKARDLEEALTWANGTAYALTGGFYSRSPANIERVKAEMEVGNLYINRGITGALVSRQPFGGFKMSGGGTKAGGVDYLQHFLFPRVVTENLMRRGFAPEEES